MNKKIIAIIFALVAAIFYSISTPFSKIMLEDVSSTMMAAFLYLGAGIGMGTIFLLTKQYKCDNKLNKKDLPYTFGMIILDIFAPIFLMIGLVSCSSSSASLLNNFEIVATTLIALILFKEKVSTKLWIGIILITISSFILSFNSVNDMELTKGSIFVLLATCCWGLENNCTRSISDKNTYQIVTVKGLFSGLGSLIIALILKDNIPDLINIIKILSLGFIAYGLSIFLYVKAQKFLGASKTSAYYAVNPFIGSFLSFIFLKERLSINYVWGLLIMIIGSIFVIIDTLNMKNVEEETVNEIS